MRRFAIAFLLMAFTSAFAAPVDRGLSGERPRSVTGTYFLKWRGDAGCTLLVQELPQSKIKFEINCNIGPPSYNLGMADGMINLVNGEGTYVTTEFRGRCEIRFKFGKNRVLVSQSGSDFECGFGHNVDCEGTYRLKNRKPPKFEPEN